VKADLLAAARSLPKIELHRHLEGSVRLDTLIDIAREYSFEMPEYDAEMLRPFVQMMPGETRNAQHFLAKFQTLRQFFRSASVIRRVAREAVLDAAADQVRYMELRFTPRALSNILNCSFEEVIEWVGSEVQQAATETGTQVRLILSMNRHESVEIGEAVIEAAVGFRHLGVVAIDLAGMEEGHPAAPFQAIFERARADGLGITIHAGEWAGAENVREAVERLHAERIGHGVRSIEDDVLVDWLAERGVTLEVCPTSNLHSGVVSTWDQHPLKPLYRRGVFTTINTDDPLVSDLRLSDEIANVIEYLALSWDDVKQQTLYAARSAFLPPEEREALVRQFSEWLNTPAAWAAPAS
jgi:adenosine deaminase